MVGPYLVIFFFFFFGPQKLISAQEAHGNKVKSLFYVWPWKLFCQSKVS
jgi:hypothetical protein